MTIWSCDQATCRFFLSFITCLCFVTVWVKEIKYYYCSLSHRWCVHLFFVVFFSSFCCFGPGSLASVVDEPRLSSGPNCPSSRWSRWASKRWRAVPHWGTEGDRLSSPPASHRRQRPSQGLRRSSLPVCLLLPDPSQLLFLCLSFLRRDLPKDKRLQGLFFHCYFFVRYLK